MNVLPFPLLKTERLRLRRLMLDDKEAIYFLRTDSRVNEFISRPKTESPEDAAEFIKGINNRIDNGHSFYWAITLAEHPEAIGAVSLWNFSADRTVAEIGYELSPAFQGKGLMQEALRVVLTFAFDELKLKAVEAFTHKNNSKSIRLLERNGFIYQQGRKDEDVPENIIFRLETLE